MNQVTFYGRVKRVEQTSAGGEACHRIMLRASAPEIVVTVLASARLMPSPPAVGKTLLVDGHLAVEDGDLVVRLGPADGRSAFLIGEAEQLGGAPAAPRDVQTAQEPGPTQSSLKGLASPQRRPAPLVQQRTAPAVDPSRIEGGPVASRGRLSNLQNATPRDEDGVVLEEVRPPSGSARPFRPRHHESGENRHAAPSPRDDEVPF